MDLKLLKIPENIAVSADFVMKHARDVWINDTALEKLRMPLEEKLAQDTDSVENAFGSTGNLDGDINLIFFETAANFCFWAQDDNDKWEVTFDGEVTGGWYGLSRAFYRAVQNNVPVHDAAFMANLSLKQAAEIFAGNNGRQIPLLESRVNNIVETARFLQANCSGSGRKFLENCGMSAPKIAEEIAKNLPNFRDGTWYQNEWIWFLKRAQILAGDLSQLSEKYPNFTIKDTGKLTIFADYRLPQVLRHYGVLRYSEELTKIVDNKLLLPSGSSQEIEIRAATIAACERLKKVCKKSTSANIDLALWLLSQDLREDPKLQPHHLTVGIYY